MRKLQELREKIDRIDDQLLTLINRRATLAVRIGQEKSRQNTSGHFHVPHREREIIDRLIRQSTGPFCADAIESVFREIFSATLALEKPLNIGYLGPETTFSHQAALKHFGHSSSFTPFNNIESIFSAVEQGNCHYGVVPVENSIEGVINLTLDCFVDSPVLICDEAVMGISLNLLSREKSLANIRKIYSHPQPFAQCRAWLNQNLPHAEQAPASSTAQAAEMAEKDEGSAAISGRLAAEVYKLNILAENIQDQTENHTRFLIIGRDKTKRAKRNKTSIMFSIRDESGTLLKALQLFARNKINLTKIQSRPLKNRQWEYLFFVDFEGHIDDKTVARVLAALEKMSLFMRVLGSYPRKN
ncbi:MAG: prephenate dehydratase [Nitrospinaceae bacterium]